MKLDKYLTILIILFIPSLILRILLTPYGTFGVDLATFQNWSEVLIRHPFDRFYELSRSDYLPGYNYFLFILGKVLYYLANYSILIDPKLLYKLPAIFADLGNAVFIYLLAKRFITPKKALISSLIFLINPAILINSTFWGQIDSVITLFLLAGLYFLLKGPYLLSAILLGLCQSIKPIPLLILPLFLIYLLKINKSFSKVFFFLGVFTLTTLIAFYPFNNQSNFLNYFFEINSMVSNRWPYATTNAFNFWTITSTSDSGNLLRIVDQVKFLGISWLHWGYLLFLSIFIYVLLKTKIMLHEKNSTKLLIWGISLSYLAMFTFFTRMHERHIFYALPFLSMLLMIVPKLGKVLISLVFLGSAFNVYFAMQLESSQPLILTNFQIILLSLINIITVIYLGLTIKKASAPLDK